MFQYPNLPWFTPQISVDSSVPGQTYTIPSHSTPFGRFHTPQAEDEVGPNAGNFGQVTPGVHSPINVRQALQAALARGLQPIPHKIGIPDLASQVNLAPPVQNHHNMVNAAASLAKFLAGQHTATLRRFQY